MSRSKESFAQVVLKATEEDRRRLGPPPSLEELADFATGELSEHESERIREHLALRGTGRDVVLDLKSFPHHEPAGEAYEVSDEQLKEAWERMATELGIGSASQAVPPAPASSPAPVARESEVTVANGLRVSWGSFFGGSSWAPALAAACLVGLVGVSYTAFSLNRTVRELSFPQLNVEVEDLTLTEVVRSGDAEPITASTAADSYVWNLNVKDLTPYSEYLVEILDDAAASVWNGRTRRRTTTGNLTLGLRRGFLPAGSYQVRLWGIDGGERKLLAEYAVRVQP